MNKGSMMFKMMCAVLCLALCLVSLPVFAEEVPEADTAAEENVTVGEEAPTDEEAADIDEDIAEDVEENVEENIDEEEEILDLYSAAMRDNGVYVTPGEDNAAVFEYNSLRYKVPVESDNLIRLDGFESDPTINSEISSTSKYMLQANGSVTTEAKHSGYFGLSVDAGEVIYRSPVTEGQVYVFSAWITLPQRGMLNENGRAFTVAGESGSDYIVGYNEIGRDIDNTSTWQQVIFTFKAPETGLFTIDFEYKGNSPLYLDDLELYEAEVFDNPLEILSIESVDSTGESFDQSTGFSNAGTVTHTTVLYSSDEDDVYFIAIAALYKNDILVDFQYSEECALVLDETEVVFEIDIPEDEDLSQYKYMVYFISDTDPTAFYGGVPSRTNPYVVKGN